MRLGKPDTIGGAEFPDAKIVISYFKQFGQAFSDPACGFKLNISLSWKIGNREALWCQGSAVNSEISPCLIRLGANPAKIPRY